MGSDERAVVDPELRARVTAASTSSPSGEGSSPAGSRSGATSSTRRPANRTATRSSNAPWRWTTSPGPALTRRRCLAADGSRLAFCWPSKRRRWSTSRSGSSVSSGPGTTGLHTDGLDRLRPRRRQHGRLQAQRADARGRYLAGRQRARGRTRPRPATGRDGIRRDRGGAVPGWRRQDLLHRLDRHRQASDGQLRRVADSRRDRGGRQGRAPRRRGRRPRRRRGRGRVGSVRQRRPDVRRGRTGLRPRAGARPVRRTPRRACPSRARRYRR